MNRLNRHFHHRRDVAPSNSFRSLLGGAALAIMLSLAMVGAYAQDGPPASGAVTVNINSADASTLAKALSGVGDRRAEDIVRYREEFGPFTTVEQLAEVKGIGKSTLEKNRAVITLD